MRRVLPMISLALAVVVATPCSASATHGQDAKVPAKQARIVLERVTADPEMRRLVLAAYDEHAGRGSTRSSEVHPSPTGDNWAVDFLVDGKPLVELAVEAETYKLLFASVTPPGGGTAHTPAKPTGYHDATGPFPTNLVMSIVMGLVFCWIFLAGRMLQLADVVDALALLSLPTVRLFMQGQRDVDVLVFAWPALLWLAGRATLRFARPRSRVSGRWELPMPPQRLVLALALSLALALPVAAVRWSIPSDVGRAGVQGADALINGSSVYGDLGDSNLVAADTYGPLGYLLYVPATRLVMELPHTVWGRSQETLAMVITHVTALLLTGLILFLALRRVAGPRVASLAALGWLVYPETAATLLFNANDLLVSMFVALTLLALGSPAGRGAALALGAMVKFVPVAAVGAILFLGAHRRARQGTVVVATGTAVIGLLLAVVVGWGDSLRDFYDAALAYQWDRAGHLDELGYQDLPTPWDWDALHPALSPVRVIVALGLLAAWFRPRSRTWSQAAAGLAGALLVVQCLAEHWLFHYAVWALPALLATFMAADLSPAGPERPSGGPRVRRTPLPQTADRPA